ncbi:MAG: hypothetical protein JWN39_1050 [Ilumatobacteraceae bacterium]|nr:hypothetical protein [Ilumatobacteraceae bacterium]
MLGRLGIWRHLVVLIAIAGCATLAFFGLIGGGNRKERFDAKQITVVPSGADGLRVREVVDEDFGTQRRHGYERIIPTDFGAPSEITASSPNANAEIGTADVFLDDRPAIRIRLGDPGTTYQDQHRYVLSYTLPHTGISRGVLNLDIIDAGERFETERFEVVLAGMTLADPTCSVGATGAVGGCTLTSDGAGYRVVFTPLHAGDGVTVRGTVVGFTDAVLPPEPDLPVYRVNHRKQLARALVPIGLVAALIVFVIAKLRGRNEVFGGGGAAEAAFGQPVGQQPPPSTHLVSDAKLASLATTEFAPPRGIDPWQGSVLLQERIDDSTVAAWFSALAASEALTLTQRDKHLVIGIGRRRSELDPANSALVNQFMHGRIELTLGTYDPYFAGAWASIKAQQAVTIEASGWWKRRPPKVDGSPAGGALAIVVIAAIALFIVGGSVASAIFGLFRTLPLALVFAAVVPAFVAYCAYATLLPVRSGTGSALALLTESFRRFLEASEGRHVEWAWKQGLLREYSAWAVSLGAADAWGKALEHSNVPASEYVSTNPLLVHSMFSSFSSTHTAPSSSGSGGSGFSGGGSVGGGGGGGSSGSW